MFGAEFPPTPVVVHYQKYIFRSVDKNPYAVKIIHDLVLNSRNGDCFNYAFIIHECHFHIPLPTIIMYFESLQRPILVSVNHTNDIKWKKKTLTTTSIMGLYSLYSLKETNLCHTCKGKQQTWKYELIYTDKCGSCKYRFNLGPLLYATLHDNWQNKLILATIRSKLFWMQMKRNPIFEMIEENHFIDDCGIIGNRPCMRINSFTSNKNM